MAEPDPDRGHVDGPAPDVVAFVVPGGDGAVLAELAERPLDGVALLIGRGVEGGRAAAPAAALEPVLDLVRGFGDGRLDPAAAQVSADRGAGVRLVAQGPPGPRRATLSCPIRGKKATESWRCPALVTRASGRHPQSASRWILLVSPPRDRPSASRFLSFASPPGGAPAGSARPAPAGPGPHRRAARAAPRPRAGAPAPPWHRPPPSTPARRPYRTRHAAGPGSSPRSRPRTSGGAGYTRSSSSRNVPADPATGTRSGSGRRSRRSPAGDHSTGAPAADAPAATAPAAPTPHH